MSALLIASALQIYCTDWYTMYNNMCNPFTLPDFNTGGLSCVLAETCGVSFFMVYRHLSKLGSTTTVLHTAASCTESATSLRAIGTRPPNITLLDSPSQGGRDAFGLSMATHHPCLLAWLKRLTG